MESSTLETVMMVISFSLLAATLITAVRAANNAWPAREQYLRAIEQTIRELSDVIGGRLVDPPHDHLQAHVVRNGLDVCVSIEHDNSPNDGVYTAIAVALPPGRAWRTPRLCYRKTAPFDIDLTSPEVFERYFSGARAHDLPEETRKRLLQLAQQDCLIRLYDRELLLFVSLPDPSSGRRTFLTNAQRQSVLIDATAQVALDLIR
ncbi:hypothetical protein [Nannocystis pusilla]|uniref:Uncharacterized protein n=1 Tax=Nannocystis pusilla TaxID=889268 RepID=A0ABS7TJJ4_9BACT|nr:hypothetical protein [Nannocystis pusilla]MBZ5708402.1 hypothetical protein [Nannocystis pusilla]